MKSIRLLTTTLSLVVLAARLAAAQSVDPSFAAPSVYAPGTVFSALEQPDGKLVVNGSFVRVNGTAVVSRLLRFNPNGTLDNAFLQNVGAPPSMRRMHLLGNGQLLLITSGPAVTAGGVTRNDLLRLNPDGTADASFNIGTGPTLLGEDVGVIEALPLPNGQVVAVGLFDEFSGAQAPNIVRLSPTGAVDPTFNAGSGANGSISTVVGLPSGQLLIGGSFTSYNGTPCGRLARLNADGSLDPTFSAPAAPSPTANITVQPDGKILASGGALTRLNADGSLDNTFTLQTPLYPYSFYGNAMQVQPDGKILVQANNAATGPLLRLHANGSPDASYQTSNSPNAFLYSLNLLASGKVLAMGSFVEYNGTLDRPLLLLTTTGAVDASFQPDLQLNGVVYALARQPDGKYVVGGNFSEINGQTARRLARLNADGSLDNGFGANTGGFGAAVSDLALQPDGKLLAAVGQQVRRQLASGSPDNSFAVGTFAGNLSHLLLQPDGKVLVSGSLLSFNGQPVPGLIRLTASGAYDNTFAPVATGLNSFPQGHAIALQPDGKVLVQAYARTTASSSAARVLRLNATGAVDPSYTSLSLTSAFGSNSNSYRVTSMVLQPDGKLLLGGSFEAVSGVPRTNLARLNADGTLDAGFVSPTPGGSVYALALQPNGRVLVGGFFTPSALPSNLYRLNADGTADASFAATAVPNGSVRTLLVQADGAIMAGGVFTSLSGQTSMAVARLTAPNVLRTLLPQAVADRTTAWPVPAHTTLHVALDPAARAQTLELLDVLGRPVRRQALSGAAQATVAVDHLPAGQYLLRVNYAAGSVTRRVSVQ